MTMEVKFQAAEINVVKAFALVAVFVVYVLSSTQKTRKKKTESDILQSYKKKTHSLKSCRPRDIAINYQHV